MPSLQVGISPVIDFYPEGSQRIDLGFKPGCISKQDNLRLGRTPAHLLKPFRVVTWVFLEVHGVLQHMRPISSVNSWYGGPQRIRQCCDPQAGAALLIRQMMLCGHAH
jgi:hypothetical protein